MPTARPFNRTFLKGLQTTRPEDGADDHTGFRRFQNVRTHKDEAEIRPGRVLLQAFASAQTAMVFDGTAGATAKLDPAVWSVGMSQWVVDGLSQGAAAAAVLLQVGDRSTPGGLRVEQLLSGAIRVEVYAAGWKQLTSSTLLGLSAGHWALVKNGLELELYIEGILEDSLTLPSAPIVETVGSLYLAQDAVSGQLFTGSIDFIRFREGLLPHNRAIRTRLLNPRSQRVRACYRDGPDADNLIWDHSVFELHAVAGGAVTTGTTLSHPHAPVQALHSFIADENSKKLFALVGGREYGGDL